MKVESPEIDSIQATTKRISNWLHHDLKEVVKPLQVLPSIPEDLRDLKERLVEQFRLLFRGEIAAEMKSREANIRVAKQKSSITEQHIENKRSRLVDEVDRVQSQAQKRLERVARDHQVDLRNLDSHAYKIVDEIYPKQIQLKFSEASTPFWGAVAEHASESVVSRTACLDEGFEAAKESIECFLEEREAFKRTFQKLTATGLKDDATYALPFWFALIKDESTGETTIEIAWDNEGDDTPIDGAFARFVRAEAEAHMNIEGSSLTDEDAHDVRDRIIDRLNNSHQLREKDRDHFVNTFRAVYIVE